MKPRISELVIQNVRCFNSKQKARLSRITLLVGENSVGKSTFLGCYKAFANLSNLVDLTPDTNPFNSSPFFMGDFETIVRSKKSSFSISGHYENDIHSTTEFSFERGGKGQPLEKFASFTFLGKDSTKSYIKIAIEEQRTNDKTQLSFQGPNFSFQMDWADISFLPIFTWLSRNVREGFLPYNADLGEFQKRRQPKITSEDIAAFGKFINFFRSEMPLPTCRRFFVEALDPQGISRRRSYEELPLKMNNDREKESVSDIGVYLGLWDKVQFRENSLSGAREIYINSVAGSHNLLDVGYGVSSLLPVVQALVAAVTPSTFLLQQPEVHVHPVAQAKLAQLMAEGPHDFIIETHSDHLVDRFRLCVKEKILRPKDLSILYFENQENGSESKIHNISVDSQGNVLDPPNSYREFFLTETKKLLGMDDTGL